MSISTFTKHSALVLGCILIGFFGASYYCDNIAPAAALGGAAGGDNGNGTAGTIPPGTPVATLTTTIPAAATTLAGVTTQAVETKSNTTIPLAVNAAVNS